MADSRDLSAPPAAATRRDEALRRRAAALRDNLKRRKAQARGREAAQDHDGARDEATTHVGPPAGDAAQDDGESA